jgi:hypothetical protein
LLDVFRIRPPEKPPPVWASQEKNNFVKAKNIDREVKKDYNNPIIYLKLFAF